MPTDLELYNQAREGGQIVYPDGYGEWDTFRTLEQLFNRHRARNGIIMEPEYERRLWAWMEHKGGYIGVGDSSRRVQPDLPGFAPAGRSFHERQRFVDGYFFCAVDLVKVGGFTEAGELITVSPNWDDVADLKEYGLHANVTGEPWHCQPIEISGWSGWVTRGRKRPVPGFHLPEGSPLPLLPSSQHHQSNQNHPSSSSHLSPHRKEHT